MQCSIKTEYLFHVLRMPFPYITYEKSYFQIAISRKRKIIEIKCILKLKVDTSRDINKILKKKICCIVRKFSKSSFLASLVPFF